MSNAFYFADSNLRLFGGRLSLCERTCFRGAKADNGHVAAGDETAAGALPFVSKKLTS
jgi:hypothetical protein